MPKIVYDNRSKFGIEKLPVGVVKRKLNSTRLGQKVFNSRNKKKCFICNTYDNVIIEQVTMFGHRTLSYVCIDCKRIKKKGDV